VTVTSDGAMTLAVTRLAGINAIVRYLSIEPLLGAITMKSHLLKGVVDWIITGACTGTRKDMEALCQRYPALSLMPLGKKWSAQPRIEWIIEIIEAAGKASIPVF